MTAFAATAPTLGAAASYAAFGKAGVTNNSNVGTTHVWGDVGADATNVTNLNDATQVDGAITSGAWVEAAILTAYGQLVAEPDTPVVLNLAGNNTVSPGVYDIGATTLNGVLTLSGAGVYVFRSSSSIAVTPGVGAEVKLTNGADACNVFWQIPTSMTIGAGAKIVGTIVADTALISLGTNATLQGRALSRIAQVTMDSNQITEPTCTPIPATLHVVKTVVNTGGGVATPSSFSLSVKNASGTVVGGPTAGTGAPGTSYSFSAGTYTVSEDVNASYSAVFSGDCDTNGLVSLAAGNDKTCTITNTYNPPMVSSGGGGGSVLLMDVCPSGDFSYSYYDKTCGIAPVALKIAAPIIIPLIGIRKVPTPLALPSGSGSVVYDYTVWNVGEQQSLADVSVTDDKCSPVVLLSGDTNNNSKLDVGENWKYRCTDILTKTTTNTAIATGHSDDVYHQPAIATAITTVVVGSPVIPPLISIVKVPSRLTPFPFGGGDVKYTYTVTNPGIAALHNVTVTDDKCASAYYVFGDTNNNALLEPNETWTYMCWAHIGVSTRNIATAQGRANGFVAQSFAIANVLVSPPLLPNTGLSPEETNNTWYKSIFIGIFLFIIGSFGMIIRKRTV